MLNEYMQKMMTRYSPSLRKRFEETLPAGRNQRMAERIGKKLHDAPGKCHFFVLGYARALQVAEAGETAGLFWQGYEMDCGTNGQLWTRGNGWALMGCVET